MSYEANGGWRFEPFSRLQNHCVLMYHHWKSRLFFSFLSLLFKNLRTLVSSKVNVLHDKCNYPFQIHCEISHDLGPIAPILPIIPHSYTPDLSSIFDIVSLASLTLSLMIEEASPPLQYYYLHHCPVWMIKIIHYWCCLMFVMMQLNDSTCLLDFVMLKHFYVHSESCQTHQYYTCAIIISLVLRSHIIFSTGESIAQTQPMNGRKGTTITIPNLE